MILRAHHTLRDGCNKHARTIRVGVWGANGGKQGVGAIDYHSKVNWVSTELTSSRTSIFVGQFPGGARPVFQGAGSNIPV
jgi:hypothetical protein